MFQVNVRAAGYLIGLASAIRMAAVAGTALAQAPIRIGASVSQTGSYQRK